MIPSLALAMLPPPAPISTRSTAVKSTGNPLPRADVSRSTSSSSVSPGAPPSDRLALAVVPPMSNEIACGQPASSAISAAISAPAAGPDSSSRTGWRETVPTPATPPLDCTTWTTPSNPARRSPCSRSFR